MHYKPVEINLLRTAGIEESIRAMRLPKYSKGDSYSKSQEGFILGDKDIHLAKALIKAGTDHAKFTRGIIAWFEMKMQAGWMLQFVTYRIGMEDLSTTSSMHNELKALHDVALAEQKQKDLVDKVYTRIFSASYQALRGIYKARRNHKHPDWRIFCKYIEQLPYFSVLIYPECEMNNNEEHY